MGKNIFLVVLFTLIMMVSPWCYKTHFSETNKINEVDVSPDRTMVVTSSDSNKAIVWNFTNLHPMFMLNCTDKVQSSKFSKNQLYIAVGQLNSNKVNILRTTASFSSLTNVTVGFNSVLEVDWSWDNARLLVCGGTLAQTYWVGNWSKQLTISISGTTINTCKFQKDGKIGLGDNNGRVHVYLNGVNTSADWTVIPTNNAVKSVDFDMINYSIGAANTVGNSFYIYTSNKSGANPTNLKTENVGSKTNTIAFSKDGSLYAVGTDNNLLIYQNSSYKISFNWTGGALSGIFTYDSQYYLSGSSTGVIRVFKRMCQSCPAGTYEFLTQCVSCSQTMIGCLNCLNSSLCQACGDGYAIDTVNNNCTLCNNTLTGCILCNSTTICTACASIYYLLSNACLSCQSISNCLTCTSSTVCTSCNTDYYLDAAKCTTCTTLSGCFTCLNATACVGCVGGYYLNTTNLTCIRCLPNCTSCFSSTNCSQCLQGYYLSSTNVCVSCPANCMKCNSTSCINCITSYYLNGTACNPCTYNCQTCLNISYCYTCIPGYYSNSGSCSPCIGNCITCTSSTACLSCNINYYYKPSTNTCNRCQTLLEGCLQCTNTTCLLCEHGYYYTGTVCSKCTQSNGCQRCLNSTYCLSCISGYQYSSSTGACSPCGIGCSACNSTVCFNCLPKYYLSSGSCLQCPSNCPTCFNSTTCSFCLEGFYLNSTLSCVACYSAIPNCVTCASNAYCTSCSLGYYLNSANSSCLKCSWPCTICTSSACFQCAVGYYLNSASCSICPNNCSSCNTGSLCTSCVNGYYLSTTLTCISCTSLSYGCQICNRTNCLNCLSNLGFYLNSSTLLCSSCSVIPNCLKCSSSGVCTTCIIGYYPSSNACSLCTNLVSNCQNCNATVCLSCIDPYYLSGSGCVLCNEGCYSCYNSSSCKSCLSGYLLQLGVCNFCNTIIKGCQICTSTSVCTQCQEGYLLSGSTCNSCASFISGCLYCNSTNVCTSCIDQYYLSGTNVCTKCSTTLAGCSQCNSSLCLECLSGYYKNSSNLCSPCNDNMCFQCSNSTFCSSCLSGYIASSAGVCQQCSIVYTGCVLCNSSLCLQCVSGFYLNSSNSCTKCLIVGCEICNDFNSSQCVTCSSLYYLSSSMTCISCTLTIQGCLNCISSTYCTKCLTGYYLAANFTCQPCSKLFKGCRECTAVSCSTCEGGYIMNTTTCSSCMQYIPGCQYCTSTTVCLSCQSGYYTLANNCLSCTTLSGCLDCSNSSSCNLCSDSYYLNSTDSLCYPCSTNIVGCVTCSSQINCKSCLGNYSLGGGICTQIVSVSTKPYRQLKMITQYVNINTLKHNLVVRGTTYTKTSINLAVNSNITMVGISSSQLLTIQSFQWGDNDNQVIFYTNNPLGSQFNSQFKSMPVKRLLQSTNVDLNYEFQLEMTESAIQAILPSSTHTGSLSLKSLADDPSFVRSLYSQKQYNYHYMGLILSIFLFIIYLIKAAVTVPQSDDQGQIISHIFLLKCGGIMYSMVYLQYIDYCFGFLTADLYWFNQLTNSLSYRFDLSPNSYLLFYSNMTLASTYLTALCLIVFIGLILLLIGWQSPQRRQSVKIIGMFFYNFFEVGLIIAGSASIQGAYYNNLNYITKNSIFYIIGILIYLGIGVVNISMSISNLHRINKMRILVKATFLSLLYISPIYLLPIAIGVQLVFIIFQFNIKKATKLHPHIWFINQLIVNLSFVILVLFSQSLLSIYASFILIVLAVVIDLVIHINQFRHQDQIIKVKEIQQLTNQLERKQKIDRKNKKKNNNIYQSTRKSESLIISELEEDEISEKIQDSKENVDNLFLIEDKYMKTGGLFTLQEELESHQI